MVIYEYYDSTKDGRLRKITQPKIQDFTASRATQFDYDNNGNVISVTEIPADKLSDSSAWRTTLTTYDDFNRPKRVVGPKYTDAHLGPIRPVTKYNYDRLGNLIQVQAGRTDSTGTNPGNDQVYLQMTYAYDDFGRKIKETDRLGKSWNFAYDMNNNLISVTDAKAQSTSYTWDYGHQLHTRTNTAGNLDYTRNPVGKVTKVINTNPSMSYSYTYDAAHRLTSATDSRGNKTLSYDYSPGGLLNWMMDSDGNRTDYIYDPVGRLAGILAPNFDYVAFRYDDDGRLMEKWLPNGVSTAYSYNPDNSLSQVINRSSTGTVLTQHDYTYDGVGDRDTHKELIGGVATHYRYVYDELSRLKEVRNNSTGALIEGYSYDELDNRLTKTDGTTTFYYIYNTANQLEEIWQGAPTWNIIASIDYDNNGNLTNRVEGSTTTSLIYDGLNRLTQVAKTSLPTQYYAYDDQGRRISKAVGSSTTNYLYNGPDIVGEYSSNWTSIAQYTHGPNMDDPIIWATASASQYYHQDGLGSVVALSDHTGATAGTQRFDAWGNKLASTGTIPLYGYTGREPDETGLIYYRARYYDPTIGRFISRDPTGFKGGINRYAYVNANPVNFTDPGGLEALDNNLTNVSTQAQATSYFGGSNANQGDSGLNAGLQSLNSGTISTQGLLQQEPVSAWNESVDLISQPLLATPDNVENLSRILTSEASIGNNTERIAVGSTVLNRMQRNNTTQVSDVWRAYAHNQLPTDEIREKARGLLFGETADNTGGATHFYSPISMPREGDSTAGYDVGGGLESTTGLSRRNYRPSWALTFETRPVTGVRERYYRFFRAPGLGPVQ